MKDIFFWSLSCQAWVKQQVCIQTLAHGYSLKQINKEMVKKALHSLKPGLVSDE